MPPPTDNRGVAKRRKGDYDGAIADCSKAIELDPKYAFAYNSRGAAKDHKGDYDGAIADFSKAIEFDPKYANAYNNRGDAEDHKGDYDGAIADYGKAIELDPKFAIAYYNRGIAKERKGDFDNRALTEELKAAFETALSDFLRSDELASKPVNHDYAQLRIWLLRASQGQTADANEELSAYLAKRWDGSPGDWTLRIADFLLGKKEESDFVAAADSTDPKKSREQHCQAWYYAAMKRLLAGDKKVAADYFAKCLATEARGSDEYMCAGAELKKLAATN
jgi:tetratricopeptide (TPR) repeat protein